MGTTASAHVPLVPPFERMSSWEFKSAKKLLQDYKDKDLDFGLDATALSELLPANDKDWATKIITAFGSTNGIVNALAFICGVVIVCPAPALEKAGLIFDALDFDATEQISMDEMTIAFLCAARGFCVLSGIGAVPSDDDLEGVTLTAYRELNKSSGQSILKSEFTRWVLQFAAGHHATTRSAASSADVQLDSALEQFGIVTPTKHDSEELDPAVKSHDTNDGIRAATAVNSIAAVSNNDDTNEHVMEQTHERVEDNEEVEVDDAAEDYCNGSDAVDGRATDNDSSESVDVNATAMAIGSSSLAEDDDLAAGVASHHNARTLEPAVSDATDDAEVSYENDARRLQADGGTADNTSTGTAIEPIAPTAEEDSVASNDEPTSLRPTVDLNDFDAYDYTQTEFDASSGLPPPEDPADYATDDDVDNITASADTHERQ